MTQGIELGIYSFGDATPDPATGRAIDVGQRVRDLVDEIVLADEVGLDVFGVGEHHRPDFPVSSPAVVLAAAAARTSRIRLTSAVTVLSSDDPVRVFQDFATIDLISQGRAEIMAGRGSFIESFPLFGYDLADYQGLVLEKLDLLLRLREDEVVTWQGRHRAPIGGGPPPPLQNQAGRRPPAPSREPAGREAARAERGPRESRITPRGTLRPRDRGYQARQHL